MTSNLMGGLCNLDHCTHPCCWSYYRKLLKHQTSAFGIEEKKQRAIEVPHQSILNFSADILLNTSFRDIPPDLNRQKEYKNNALLEYLISRKKMSSLMPPQITPYPTEIHIRDSSNVTSVPNKIATLDVHEIFDLEELQSDWRKTFQAKDYYVWVPGKKESKNAKDDWRPTRSVKTPILQLAPVTGSRNNSSNVTSGRKDLIFAGCGSDNNNQKTPSLKVRTIQRPTTRTEPLDDNIISKTKEVKNARESFRNKSLETTLNQAKMQIHNLSNKTFTKYDVFNTSKVYVLDENCQHDPRDISSSRLSRQPPASPNISETGNSRSLTHGKDSRINQVHFKGVSIIQNENSFDFKLEPQPKCIAPLKSALSQRKDFYQHSVDDGSSTCDSMATNAISNRSTLLDDDILPGSNMINILQSSYQLIQERSENLAERNRESTGNKEDHAQDREVHLHKVNVSYSRTAKSAPEKKVINIEIPKPPPPTPDITDRIRPTSAAANINFCE